MTLDIPHAMAPHAMAPHAMAPHDMAPHDMAFHGSEATPQERIQNVPSKG